MRATVGAVAVLLLLLLAGVAGAAEAAEPDAGPGSDPGPACLEAVRAYVTDVYANRVAEALSRVRGVDASDKGARFEHLIQDSISSRGYRALAECGYNLFALSGAVEARDGGPPASLEDVVGPGTTFPRGMPECPAGGRYGFARSKDGGYRIWCGTDAHEGIGVAGDYPEFSKRGGLSVGDQRLRLAPLPRFEIADWSLEVEDVDEERGVVRIRHREKSRLGGPRRPLLERSSAFMLSFQDGEWRIDLALSNRDMVFEFDEEQWTRAATLPRQVLFYYQASEVVGFHTPDIEDRPHLELRICEANLRSLSLAVEEWSIQQSGAYPASALAVVTPAFLREMPRCPAGGQYRYRFEPPGSYRIWCDGDHHAEAGVPAGYPALTPILGVVEGP